MRKVEDVLTEVFRWDRLFRHQGNYWNSDFKETSSSRNNDASGLVEKEEEEEEKEEEEEEKKVVVVGIIDGPNEA